jgi:protocatechuate 3,4-dioxygenase beta subunit
MTIEIDPLEPQPTRRDVLIKGVLTSLAVAGFGSRAGIALASIPGVTHGETPGVTEGPYWVDGQLARSDVRLNTSTDTITAGLPVHLGITISQLKDTSPYTIAPLVGAKVDIWCANAQGVYSDEAVESTTGEDYLRGYQITSSHGTVNFLTIYPGWYSGRTPHIFFNEIVTGQVFNLAAYARPTARDTYNSTDNVFTGSSQNGSPAKEAGDYLMLTMANDGTFVAGTFHIVVDLSDSANADPTGGSETAGGGGGAPPGASKSVSKVSSPKTSSTPAKPTTPAKPRPGSLRSRRGG